MWIEPYTEWSNGSLCGPSDMNRISGNINHLLGTNELIDTYNNNDFVYKSEFEKVVNSINQLLIYTGISYDNLPTMETTADNFNLIESLTLEIKNRMIGKEINSIAVKFAGEVYAGNSICGGM